MLTNAYSLIHETFLDEHYHDVRNLRYWIAYRSLTARFDPVFYQKTNLPENQTKTIHALIAPPFNDINISGIANNISSNMTKLKTLYDYIEKRKFTELESQVLLVITKKKKIK